MTRGRTEKHMAGEPGFEPGLRDPESRVLPLDDSPAYCRLYHRVERHGKRDSYAISRLGLVDPTGSRNGL